MILDLHSVANVLSGIKYTHSADHLLTGLIEECYTYPGIYTWYKPSPDRSDRRMLHSPWDTDHLLAGLTEDCYTHPEIYT